MGTHYSNNLKINSPKSYSKYEIECLKTLFFVINTIYSWNQIRRGVGCKFHKLNAHRYTHLFTPTQCALCYKCTQQRNCKSLSSNIELYQKRISIWLRIVRALQNLYYEYNKLRVNSSFPGFHLRKNLPDMYLACKLVLYRVFLMPSRLNYITYMLILECVIELFL